MSDAQDTTIGGCRSYDDGRVWVCSPRSVVQRKYAQCPHCRTGRRVVVLHAVWYDPLYTCCTCGERWEPTEGVLPRPFRPRWREEHARRAREQWDAAPPASQWREIHQRMVEEAL